MTAAIKLNSHRSRRRDATRRSSSFACAPPRTRSRIPSAVTAINAMANKANKRDQASICLIRASENPRSHFKSLNPSLQSNLKPYSLVAGSARKGGLLTRYHLPHLPVLSPARLIVTQSLGGKL